MNISELETLPVPSDLSFHYYPPSLARKYGLVPFSIKPACVKGPEVPSADWQPNRDPNRVATNANGAKTKLPASWPRRLDGPMAWTGRSLPEEISYTYSLSEEEREEIRRALLVVKERNIHFSDVGKLEFPLPNLGPILEKLGLDLYQGQGFFVLRGLQPSMYSREENFYIYLGVSSYIGSKRGRINPRGEMIAHIVQAPSEFLTEKGITPSFSTSAQPFHADIGTDILALYYLNTAAKGGRTMIASAWTVYNELSRNRPNILVELASDDWVHNTFGHYPPFFTRPLMFLADGKPILNYSRRVITGNAASPRDPRAPPVSQAQIDALDTVHFEAEKHCLKLDNRKGDMLFVNNFGLLHAREQFQDDEVSRRHLLRLWLRNEEQGWVIPEGLRLESDNLFEPAEELEEVWNLEPDFARKQGPESKTSRCT